MCDIIRPISVLVSPRMHARRAVVPVKALVGDRKASDRPSSLALLDGGMSIPSDRCKPPGRRYYSWSWGESGRARAWAASCLLDTAVAHPRATRGSNQGSNGFWPPVRYVRDFSGAGAHSFMQGWSCTSLCMDIPGLCTCSCASRHGHAHFVVRFSYPAFGGDLPALICRDCEMLDLGCLVGESAASRLGRTAARRAMRIPGIWAGISSGLQLHSVDGL